MSIDLQEKQSIAFLTPATEYLYGGAAGGGKSFLLRVSGIRWCLEIPGIQVYLFRRTLPDLRDNHLRGPTSFFVMLEKGIKTGQIKYRAQENEFEFPGGSVLHLCYCDSENDVEKYRGAEIHVLCCEENERIRMADGSLKRVSDIRVNDNVETLQGPRAVTCVGQRKLKPCVEATVGNFKQVHSTSHKVLTPGGWVSYDDIACEPLQSLICESTLFCSAHRSGAQYSSEPRSASLSHETPSLNFSRNGEPPRLFQDWKDVSETAVCMEQSEAGTDFVASSNGNATSQQPFSGFSFPVVLCEPIPPTTADAFFPSSQRDGTSYVQSECTEKGSLSGYQTSSRLHGEYQPHHSNNAHDGARIPSDVEQHNPRNLISGDPGITPERTPYKSLRYSHPYTGEERFSAKPVRLDTCFVAPCGERWTIDLTVDGENHYITESGFVNKNCMDELTHFSEYQFRFLRSRVRIAGLKIPDAYKTRLPRVECATNPGSIGHAWVKRTFITPKPPLVIYRAPPDEGGMLRQFIPAKLADNPFLTKEDPQYADRLRGLGAKDLVRAMLDGDWNLVAGQAFEKLRPETHMLDPFVPPDDWLKFGSFDWGSTRPFSYGMWAVAGDAMKVGKIMVPRGALVRYNEWYGWNGKPNEGLRMEAPEVARGILAKEDGVKPAYRIADSSMYAVDGGPSIAETFNKHGCVLRPAPKGPGSRHNGYVEVRARINGGDEGPMLFATSNCHSGFWRTMPDLVMDEHQYGIKSESIDTDQEDHCSDEVMYACNSRPWLRHVEEKKAPADTWMRFKEKEDRSWRTV